MEEQKRRFDGVWIPVEIWNDSRLNINDKFYLAIYNQFSKNEQITNKLMNINCSKRTLSNIKQKLLRLNLIDNKEVDYIDAKKMVLEQKGIGEKCEWCGARTMAIQKHHYPIPASKGGTNVVSICPNCHYEFHRILKN